MFDKFNIHQKYSILIVLMLIILTIGVYWPVQNYEFINFDDNVYVTENSHIQSGFTLDGFCWAFSTKYFDFMDASGVPFPICSIISFLVLMPVVIIGQM